MTIAADTKLGRYEIVSLIGAGGMGEVYSARDPKLGRDVAIKVLPAAFSADAERLRRFEQEAQAAGALNHPNILSIYDVATHDDSLYVVSELLEGETLRERLSDTSLPPRKAIDYALQIARGLAAAHEKGIVHRDIKPENLFITKDGRVKILDFGLAKLIEPKNESAAQTDVPTRIVHTNPGAVMGTAGYMSPEQVRGRAVDHRSDIFAFGAVLYEMLSGDRAFKGESAVEMLNAILKEDPPDISVTNSNVPPALERVVRHCMEKSPEERFQSARDLAFALEAVSGFSGSQTFAADVDPLPSVRQKSRERLAWITAGVMLLGLLAALPFAVSYFRRAPAETNAIRFPVSLPENARFASDVESHNLSVSPDGRRLAFVAESEGQRMVWVRSLDTLSAQSLPGTEGAISPFWSPDNRYLAFFAEGKLKKIEAAGGSVQTVCSLSGEVDAVGTWGRDGTILFVVADYEKGGIYRVAAAGGAPTLLMKNDNANTNYWLHFLPDGRHFLFSTNSEQSERIGIYVGSIDSPETKQLVQIYTRAEYAPPGYLLYARDSTLLAQEFDANNLRLTGEPFAVVERLPYFDKTGWAEFSVSENGVLAYLSNTLTSRLVWFDRGGREMEQIGAAGEHYGQRFSPDGQKLAMVTVDKQTGSGDLWIHDIARDTRTRFTVGASDDSEPVWSPDGRRLAFFSCCESGKSSLRIKDLSDTTSSGQSPFQSGFNAPFDWSSDGRFIIYSQNEPTTQRDMWVLPLFEEQKPFPFLQTQFDERDARFSPDGRWVAFISNESGREEIYVTRFDQPGEKWRISTAGGRSPRWRRDGKELFYLAADKKLMSVAVKGAATFEAGTPIALFKIDSIIEGDYEVTADGQRFLINSSVTGTQSLPFTVVLNWTADLKR
ncbi:MAG: protein kinase domain-containing protein [Pyrinomonadaceae bacterium]